MQVRFLRDQVDPLSGRHVADEVDKVADEVVDFLLELGAVEVVEPEKSDYVEKRPRKAGK